MFRLHLIAMFYQTGSDTIQRSASISCHVNEDLIEDCVFVCVCVCMCVYVSAQMSMTSLYSRLSTVLLFTIH